MSKLYTPAERDFIVDNYRYLTNKQIANHLGRTPNAIQQWKEKNKLFTKDGSLAADALNKVGIMKSLIHFCETTSNTVLKQAAKVKLMQLSEIPSPNVWGIDTVIRYASRSNPGKKFAL